MEEFMSYLDGKIADGKAEIASLEADGRRDDADLAKVRANIYEVIRTVTGTLAGRPGLGAGAAAAQMERFRAAWGAALEKAREYGDERRIAVEEIKLSVLSEARERFREAAGV